MPDIESTVQKANEAIEQLKIQQENMDTEVAHIEADSILCNFLEFLGYQKIVEEFHKVDKWYS